MALNSLEQNYIFNIANKNEKNINDIHRKENYFLHIPMFSGRINLGDYVQTIAVKQILDSLYQADCIRSGGNGVKPFLGVPMRTWPGQNPQTQLFAHLLSNLHDRLVYGEVLRKSLQMVADTSPQHLKIGPLLLPACLLEGK